MFCPLVLGIKHTFKIKDIVLLLQAKKTYHTKFKFLPYCVNGWGKGEEKRGTCLLWLHFRLRLVPTHQETARLQAASGAHRSLKLFDGMSFCQYKVEDEYCSFYQNNAIYFMARTFQKWIWCANYYVLVYAKSYFLTS